MDWQWIGLLAFKIFISATVILVLLLIVFGDELTEDFEDTEI